MGGICSRLSFGKGRNDQKEQGGKFLGVQVADPLNKEDVSQNCKTQGSVRSVSKHGAWVEDGKNRIIERLKDGCHRKSTSKRDIGSKRLQKINSIPGGAQGAQIAAGWPSWLTSVAAEAIQGWVPRTAESFEMLNKIGQGTYSSVYKARDLLTDEIVAIKKVRFVNMDPESVRFMAREICILRRLDHPNVMKLKALVTSRLSGSLYLVFYYMEHDLAGLLASPKAKFTEPQIKCYIEQLLRGLQHCHSRGILHRDLKGSNLLLDNNGILKIGDFGLAARFQPGQSEPLTSRVVTLWYRAPELLFGSTSYGVAIDMWSAGCILAELFAGKPIMPGRTEVEQIHKIFKLCGSPSEEYWKKSKLPLATSFKPQHPYKRCIAETFKHLPSSALALLDTLLAIEPDARGTATSALSTEFFTTNPLPCNPSSLPEYPPSKELDARHHQEEARRRKAEAVKGHVPAESVRIGVRELKPQSREQGQSNTTKYNPQEKNGIGKNGFSCSNSMIHQSATGYALTKKIKDDAVCTSFRIGPLHIDTALKGPMSNMHLVPDSTKHNNVSSKDTMKKNKMHHSGPLMPPGGNMEDMLKEHERHMQVAVRKARMEKTET